MSTTTVTRHSGTALLSPPNNNSRGKFQLIDEAGNPKGKELIYFHSKYSPPIKEHGIYSITYTTKRQISSKTGRPYTAIYINEAVHTLPQSTVALKEVLKSATGHADKIIDRLNFDRPINEVLADLSNISFLTKIPGIGKKTAESLIEKIGAADFDDIELKFMSIMSEHGIQYSRSQKRAQFAVAYFRRYNEDLNEFRNNPYMLLRVADVQNSRKAKTVASSKQSLRPVSYTLRNLDPQVLKKEPRWQKHVYRMQAYLTQAIEDAMSDGHSVVLLEEIAQSLSNYGIDTIQHRLDDLTCSHLSLDEIRSNIKSTPGLAMVKMRDGHGNELEGGTLESVIKWQKTIAKVAKKLSSSKSPFSKTLSQTMYDYALKDTPFDLTREQKTALKYAFNSPFSAITGKPGSGKTFCSQRFLNGVQLLSVQRTLPSMNNLTETETRTAFNTYILAPTGVAVQRIRLGLELHDPLTKDHVELQKIDHSWLSEETYSLEFGKTSLGTLHSFLGFSGSGHWRIPPPHPSILFVDEASMIDEEPMYQLMLYIESCLDHNIPVMLFLSGDENQLPPVGIGFPFRDMLGMQTGAMMPVARLSIPQRQKGKSQIIEASNAILEGNIPNANVDLNSSDFFWAKPTSASQTYDAGVLLEQYRNYLRKYRNTRIREEDIQIIVPLRNKSKVEEQALNVNTLNAYLQERYASAKRRHIYTFDACSEEDEDNVYQVKFALGDKVIHTGPNGYTKKDCEPIMRGSIGTIVEIDEDNIWVNFPWLEDNVLYASDVEHDYIRLAYAITGHAAQGSEFDHVLLCVPFRAGPGLVDRSWLYTAVTRAKKHLMLVASEKRINKAVQHNQGMIRRTMLAATVVYQQYT